MLRTGFLLRYISDQQLRSTKAGRISASTILRRLGTYSRKNRLYQAFSELGRQIVSS